MAKTKAAETAETKKTCKKCACKVAAAAPAKKAVKKATPARDEKGRFIKKADTEKKTTAKKTKKAA